VKTQKRVIKIMNESTSMLRSWLSRPRRMKVIPSMKDAPIVNLSKLFRLLERGMKRPSSVAATPNSVRIHILCAGLIPAEYAAINGMEMSAPVNMPVHPAQKLLPPR